ncbi:MAG: hypothetical protein ACR2N2_05590 [Acidimicrobiia bacterium]
MTSRIGSYAARALGTLALAALGWILFVGSPAGAGVGSDGFGVVDSTTGVWYLRDSGTGATTSFYFGDPGDSPFVGDWDCDGVDTPGLFRRSDGFVYLRNSNTQGTADLEFFFGNPGDYPLVGDFNGDGCDTVSIYRPAEARVYVINALGEDGKGLGAADFSYLFGNPGDVPFTGDFNGDGVHMVGLHRISTGLVYYRNTHTQGSADDQFVFGNPGDLIVAGAWTDAHTHDTVGLFRPLQGVMYLNYANAATVADEEHLYGSQNMVPIAGSFGTLPGLDDPPPGNPELETSPVFTIGDSVMLGVGCTPDRTQCLGGVWNLEQVIPDLRSDASVSRGYGVADTILEDYLAQGNNPRVIVVHLGTNGAPSLSQVLDVIDAAGPDRRVLLVNVRQSNTANQATANARIAEAAQLRENAELVDWYAEAESELDLDAIDPSYGAHLWSTSARRVYVELIEAAIAGS